MLIFYIYLYLWSHLFVYNYFFSFIYLKFGSCLYIIRFSTSSAVLSVEHIVILSLVGVQ